MSATGEVTILLRRLHDGDADALEDLMPLLYDELRTLARKQLRRERPGHTLSTTGLVNEAYLKLVNQQRLRVEDRGHFFAIAATTMRRILVDYARARTRQKRGGGQQPVPLEEAEHFLSSEEAEQVLALDEALDRLAVINPRGSDVVNLRFFSGLTLEETADALNVSIKTVQRSWVAARAWLRKEVAYDLQF